MAARTKIVNESEVVHWIEDGWTYAQMTETYLTKYNLVVSPTMFSNFRRRKGLDRRYTRDDELIPWEVDPKHKWAYPLQMLRAEAKVRDGKSISEATAKRLAAFHRFLEEERAVVYYDPNTDQGFHFVPREARDTDIIRRPGPKHRTQRRNAG